jgi:hypothetical protein
MRESFFQFEGSLNFRFTTLDVVATIAYDLDGYLDIREMFVKSDRRNCLVPASPRLMLAFQEANWNYLQLEAYRHSRDTAEYCADLRAHEQIERRREMAA